MTATLLLSWVALSSLATAVIAVAATAAHRLAGRIMPSRFIWAGALAVSAIVTATLPLRQPVPAVAVPAATTAGVPTVVFSAAPATPLERLVSALQTAQGALRDGARDRVATVTNGVARALSPVQAQMLMALWPATTLIMAVVLMASYRHEHHGHDERGAHGELSPASYAAAPGHALPPGCRHDLHQPADRSGGDRRVHTSHSGAAMVALA